MFVVSFEMALAMPKSMSLREPFTNTKLAGFRSPCTTWNEREGRGEAGGVHMTGW